MRHTPAYGGRWRGQRSCEQPSGETEEEAMAQESGYVPQAGGATRWHDTVRRTERWEGRPVEFTAGEIPAEPDAPRSVANPRRTVLVRYRAAPVGGPDE